MATWAARSFWAQVGLAVAASCVACGAVESPAAPADSSEIVLPWARDTGVSSFAGEEDGNLGRERSLKLKGIQELVLFDLDVEPLRGRVVEEATLWMRSRSDDPLAEISVSTVSSPWNEGSSGDYAVDPEGASFLAPGVEGEDWAYPGSDLTAVVLGEGQSRYGRVTATGPNPEGWQSVAFPLEVLGARIAGLSGGFALADDRGSEYLREGESFEHLPFPNRVFASREAGAGSQPYVLVRLGEPDEQPPETVSELAVECDRTRRGHALVGWTEPPDRGGAGVAGFELRWGGSPLTWEEATPLPWFRVPLGGTEGVRRTASFPIDTGTDAAAQADELSVFVRAVDRAGNAGEVSRTTWDLPLRCARLLPPLLAERRSAPSAESATPRDELEGWQLSIVDELDKVTSQGEISLPAPEAPSTEESAPRRVVARERDARSSDGTLHLSAAANEFVAFQVLAHGGARPLRVEPRWRWFSEGREIEASGPPAEVRVLQPLFVADSAGGGAFPDPVVALVGGAWRWPAELATVGLLYVELYVPHDTPPGRYRGEFSVTGPASSAWSQPVVLDVLDFALPDRLSFLAQMNAYRLPEGSELDLYRLAHEHRATLNRVPYNWKGGVRDGLAPEVRAGDWNWGAYDRRQGPLLDGSAFLDLPRSGVPVEAMYLPLNENWPVPIDTGFRGGYWAESALTPEYRRDFVEGARRFAEHFAERGWTETLFEFYLNNKVTYKGRRSGWSDSSAPWIFDEPVNAQDFLALRWFGEAFREGVRVDSSVPFVFRVDVSRPQWQRDLLDGVVDVAVVQDPAFRRYAPLVRDRLARAGGVAYSYGRPPTLGESQLGLAAWCVEGWFAGLHGVLPWQSVGTHKSWSEADRLALLYPPRPGHPPAPSLRLKAFRRGQQDVEYLEIYRQAQGLSREEVLEVLQAVIGSNLRQGDALNRLRAATGAELHRLAPPRRDRWVDWQSLARAASPERNPS